jgi:ribosomal protein S18 acetylase RimI-like enzyme
MNITLRSSTEADRNFLYQVYVSTRLEELAPAGWTHEQMNAFLSMQFMAQDTFYRQEYKGMEFLIILLDDQPIGRYYIYRDKVYIILMDIALLPDYRGRGIGTKLIQDLLTEAQTSQLRVQLYVEFNNRAQNLYTRFGFKQIAEEGLYHQMEWSPT